MAFKPIEGFEPKSQIYMSIIKAAITRHATSPGMFGTQG